MLLHLVGFTCYFHHGVVTQFKQKPEASVALLHDSVWCDHLPDVSMDCPAQ